MYPEEDASARFIEKYVKKYVDRIEDFYQNELGINNINVPILTWMVIFIILPAIVFYYALAVMPPYFIFGFLFGLFGVKIIKSLVGILNFIERLLKVVNKFPKYLTGNNFGKYLNN